MLFCFATCLHVDKRNSLFVAPSPNLLTAPVSILDKKRNCIKRINATHCYTNQVWIKIFFFQGSGVLEIYLFTGGMGFPRPIFDSFTMWILQPPFPSSLDPCVANGLEDWKSDVSAVLINFYYWISAVTF